MNFSMSNYLGSIRPFAGVLLLFVGAGTGQTQDAAPELNEARFEELHAMLEPNGSELWRSIPWKIALLDAQRVAAQERKPIFIWAMDGHPLGCT